MVNFRYATAALLALALPLQASSAKFFQANTQSDFLKGDLENLSVDSRGQLMLGQRTELLYEASSPVLWTLLPRPDGSFLVGSGNDGKVFRVDAQGRGTTFFDAQELEVHALAAAPDGTVYAATSPDGKIYKIDRSGTATTFFDPEDKYIWALALDAKSNVYAATGEKGVVYKIAPDGKGEVFYKTKATHATALTFDSNGRLLVGTESPGRIFRVDPDGRGFLLLDTAFDEIRSLRFDSKGMLYAAAQMGHGATGATPAADTDDDKVPDKPSAPSDPTRAPVPTVTTEITSITIVDSSSGSAGSVREDTRTVRGAVYRIAPDGLWDRLWESKEDTPYDVLPDAAGRLIVATGNSGKIFRLEGEPLRTTLVARAAAQQVTAVQSSGSALYFTTANSGKLYRVSSELADRGTFQSQVYDAGTVASWGTIRWHAQPDDARVEISSRSGNSSTPDDTWSPWSNRYGTASGSAISSPNARYFQWRAVFNRGGQNAALTSVAAAYLQRNIRPVVRSITIHPPGIVFQKPYSNADPDLAGFDNQTTPDRKLAAAAANSSSAGSSMGRRGYEKGLQTIAWKADDENGDDLSYDVEYRREGDSAWKPLRRGITDSIFVWDTTTVANGTYFVRVTASDAPSNGAAAALTGELDSAAFDIDNTAPVIAVRNFRVTGDTTRIALDVTDDQSVISRVEWSRDGQDWQPVFPQDGIADSKSEHYELTLSGVVGPRGIIVRATDAMNNVATTEVTAPR